MIHKKSSSVVLDQATVFLFNVNRKLLYGGGGTSLHRTVQYGNGIELGL
jgi:hypothetical protein